METKLGKRSVFPFYLRPGPDENLLKWVGSHLQHKRGRKTVADIAKATKVSTSEIEQIENGTFHLSLARLRYILRRGYGCSLEDILAKCYASLKDRFDSKKRRFVRDYYYTFCLLDDGDKRPTPVLIGGDPEKFLWAAPFRKLRKQPLVTELLELSPARARNSSGVVPENSHNGVEVVHVIHGSIEVRIEGESEGAYTRKLKSGDSIHFNSAYAHQIKNDRNTTSALLFIVRLQQLPSGKY